MSGAALTRDLLQRVPGGDGGDRAPCPDPREATSIRAWEPLVVPGLPQTEGYSATSTTGRARGSSPGAEQVVGAPFVAPMTSSSLV